MITDLALGRGISGMDVLRASKEARAETAVVMITAHGSEKVAVEAMKQGAEDYVPKPFDNEELRVVVRKALERTQLQREHRLLLERVERDFSFENLIGQGRADEADLRDDPEGRGDGSLACSCAARAAPARSWSRRRCTSAARGARSRSSR